MVSIFPFSSLCSTSSIDQSMLVIIDLWPVGVDVSVSYSAWRLVDRRPVGSYPRTRLRAVTWDLQ